MVAEELLVDPLLLPPPQPVPSRKEQIHEGGVWVENWVWELKGGLALGQRPLIYLAYRVLFETRPPRIVYIPETKSIGWQFPSSSTS